LVREHAILITHAGQFEMHIATYCLPNHPYLRKCSPKWSSDMSKAIPGVDARHEQICDSGNHATEYPTCQRQGEDMSATFLHWGICFCSCVRRRFIVVVTFLTPGKCGVVVKDVGVEKRDREKEVQLKRKAEPRWVL
jgi:hypothetical protein